MTIDYGLTCTEALDAELPELLPVIAAGAGAKDTVQLGLEVQRQWAT